MNKFFDFNNPFYRPLWVRLVVVGASLGWGLVEFVIGSPFWGVLFCGMGAVALHKLFIAFDPDAIEQTGQPQPENQQHENREKSDV